jgi:Tol biopolymer transport system component
MAYQWLAGAGDGILLVRADGTGWHRIGGRAAVEQIHPDWSPDGRQLAFIAITSADRHRLWVVNADGTDPRELFACDLPCNTISYPDWAADGKAIYYGMDSNPNANGIPNNFEVGRYDLATSKATVALEFGDGVVAEQPRVSPDGTQVAYMRSKDAVDSNLGTAIFVANLKTGAPKQLTEYTGFGGYPDWSADGLIVFNTRDLGLFQETTEPANLYTIKPDGSGLVQLTHFGESETRATQPRWTPDGSGIVFTQVKGLGMGNRTLAFINADGSGQRFFTPEALNGTHPVLRPPPS